MLSLVLKFLYQAVICRKMEERNVGLYTHVWNELCVSLDKKQNAFKFRKRSKLLFLFLDLP